MLKAEKIVKDLMKLEGALAAMLVDAESGMVLAQESNGFDTDTAAAGCTRMVQAQLDTMKMLGLHGGIDDMLITLENQYHLVRPVVGEDGDDAIFGYLVVRRDGVNLAMARTMLKSALRDFHL